MSLDHNKAVVRRLFDELVNGYDLQVVDEIIAPDIVLHDPMFGTQSGSEMFMQLLDVFRTAFPEQHTTLDLVTAEGDLVTALHTHTGRHLGPFRGMPPTVSFSSRVAARRRRLASEQAARETASRCRSLRLWRSPTSLSADFIW